MIDLRYKKQVYQGNFVLRNYCRQVKFHSNKKILLEKVAKNQRIFKFSMVQCFLLFFFTADQRNYRIVTNIDKRNIEQPLSLGIWITVFFFAFPILLLQLLVILSLVFRIAFAVAVLFQLINIKILACKIIHLSFQQGKSFVDITQQVLDQG